MKRESEETFGLEKKEWNETSRVHLYHMRSAYVFCV